MYLQNWGDEEEFFSVSRLKNFLCPIISPPKGHFSIISTEKFLLQTATTLQRPLFFFYEQSIHSLLFTTATFFCLQGLKEVRQLCSIIPSQKRPTRKIFPLFPMVLFLFSPRELIKRPSLGPLNKYLGQTLTNHQQVK